MITTCYTHINNYKHNHISFKSGLHAHFNTSVDSRNINYTSAEELEQDYFYGRKIEKLNKIIDKLNKGLDKEINPTKKQKISQKLTKFLNQKSNYVDILVNKHLPFALLLSNQYQKLHMPQKMIDSSALLGLFEAAEKWSPSLAPDKKFTTYAKYPIQKQIRRDRVDDNQIKLPHGTYWQKIKIDQTVEKLTIKNGHTPSIEEIIQELKTMEDFKSLSDNILRKKIINTNFKLVSLNKPFEKGHHYQLSLEEIFIDDLQEQSFKNFEKEDLFNYVLSEIKKSLTPKEQDLILSKFGFDRKGNYTGKERTLQELANKYSCSKENVRARINNICLKLQKSIKF